MKKNIICLLGICCINMGCGSANHTSKAEITQVLKSESLALQTLPESVLEINPATEKIPSLPVAHLNMPGVAAVHFPQHDLSHNFKAINPSFQLPQPPLPNDAQGGPPGIDHRLPGLPGELGGGLPPGMSLAPVQEGPTTLPVGNSPVGQNTTGLAGQAFPVMQQLPGLIPASPGVQVGASDPAARAQSDRAASPRE